MWISPWGSFREFSSDGGWIPRRRRSKRASIKGVGSIFGNYTGIPVIPSGLTGLDLFTVGRAVQGLTVRR